MEEKENKKNINVTVLEYQLIHPFINLKLKTLDKKAFDLAMLCCYVSELYNGYKIKKMFKTSSKGTKIVYEMIKNDKDFENYKSTINKFIEQINSEYNLNIKLEL